MVALIGSQDLGLSQSLMVGVVNVRARRLGQLGQTDALAERAGRFEGLVPLAAGGRGYGTRRYGGRAASSEELGACIVQPRLDAAHACEHPATAKCIQESEGQAGREPVWRASRGEAGLAMARWSYLVLYRRLQRLSDGSAVTRCAVDEIVMQNVQRKKPAITVKERMGSN